MYFMVGGGCKNLLNLGLATAVKSFATVPIEYYFTGTESRAPMVNGNKKCEM